MPAAHWWSSICSSCDTQSNGAWTQQAWIALMPSKSLWTACHSCCRYWRKTQSQRAGLPWLPCLHRTYTVDRLGWDGGDGYLREKESYGVVQEPVYLVYLLIESWLTLLFWLLWPLAVGALLAGAWVLGLSPRQLRPIIASLGWPLWLFHGRFSEW